MCDGILAIVDGILELPLQGSSVDVLDNFLFVLDCHDRRPHGKAVHDDIHRSRQAVTLREAHTRARAATTVPRPRYTP